jgi:addiction module RelE/StbE family toxin
MVEKIIWTQKALLDLSEIFDYINKDSPHYASLTIQKIINKISLIKGSPLAGRIVPEFNNVALREVIYKNYRIIYKIDKSEAYIVRIYNTYRLLSGI